MACSQKIIKLIRVGQVLSTKFAQGLFYQWRQQHYCQFFFASDCENMMLRSDILTYIALLSTVPVQSSSNDSLTYPSSDFVMQATKKWLKNTAPFRNCSSDEEISNAIDDLLSWEAPDYFVKHFPYYLAGLSYEKFPIYIGECGKYDAVALMSQRPEVVENIDKAIVQGIVQGLRYRSSMENDEPVENIKSYVILDFEGFAYARYTSVPALELLTRLALQYLPMAGHFIEKIYVINGNFALDSLYDMYRPIVGRLAERIEIYGSKKSKWLATLTREFPPEALPPWYGGLDSFTPIATYG